MDSHNKAVRAVDQFLLDDPVRKGLFACSAALTLDDDTACRVVEVVVGSNSSAGNIVRQIKDLGIVWHHGDGTWSIARDVRGELLERLFDEVGDDNLDRLHRLLAEETERRLAALRPDGAANISRIRSAKVEAAYQRMLTREAAGVAEGGRALAAVWRGAEGVSKMAVCRAVETLSPDLDRRLELGRLPDEVLFLRGKAALPRDQQTAKQYFEMVWQRGRALSHRDDFHAIAALHFGNHEKNARTAEEAFRDSLAWTKDTACMGEVYHSLGKLLARDPKRWLETETAFQKSRDFVDEKEDRAQVLASWVNALYQRFLSKDGELADGEKAKKLALIAHDLTERSHIRDLMSQTLEKLNERLSAPAKIDIGPTPTTSSPGSPFIVGQPVSPEDLIGRKEQCGLLRTAVTAGQSVQILGGVRMGKTSLLRWVEHFAPKWRDHRAIFVNAPRLYSPEDFVREIAKELDRESKVEQMLGRSSVHRVLEELPPLVLLVDEAGALAEPGRHYDAKFLGHLRALCEEQKLVWISAAPRDLRESFRERGMLSKFLNDSRHTWLGQLEDEDARQLVRQLNKADTAERALRQVGGLDAVVEWALRQAGGFAYGLQWLCDKVWKKIHPDDREERNKELKNIYMSDLQEIGDRFGIRMESDFHSWWWACNADEKTLLQDCAKKDIRKNLPKQLRGPAIRLKDLGLLIERNECLVLPGTAWQEFVRDC